MKILNYQSLLVIKNMICILKKCLNRIKILEE